MDTNYPGYYDDPKVAKTIKRCIEMGIPITKATDSDEYYSITTLRGKMCFKRLNQEGGSEGSNGCNLL